MNKKKILSIGYTRSLLNDNLSIGDSTKRLIEYSKYLSQYHIICHSLKEHNTIEYKEINDNMFIYGSNAINRLLSYTKIFFLARKVFRKSRIDIIQAQDPIFTGSIAFLLSLIYKKPYNVCVYGTDPYDNNYLNNIGFLKLFGFIAKFFISRANGVQVDGQSIKNSLISNGIKEERIFYKPMIPTNIQSFFEIQKDNDKYNRLIENNKYSHLLLFVGRLSKQKNITLLIKAVKQTIQSGLNPRLVIIGTGPSEEMLKKLVYSYKLGDNIIFLGRLPHETVISYYGIADLFVLSSDYEGFPRVLMEAAASGIPILTTKVSGVEEIIPNNHLHHVVPINDLDAYVERLVFLLKNNSEREKLGKEIQAKFFLLKEKYTDLKRQIDIWEKILEDNSRVKTTS